jgi:7-carboxy-7-deazaguanine synthase
MSIIPLLSTTKAVFSPAKNPPHGLVRSAVLFPQNLPEDVAPIQEIFSSIQGEGIYAGARQIFVRFAHCHLQCAYCDTPMTTPDGRCMVEAVPGSNQWHSLESPVAEANLVALVQHFITQYGTHHSVSFTGGEPLLYKPYLQQVLPAIQQLGVKTYLETSGTQPHLLKPLLPFLDVVAMDVKLPSATKQAPRWTEHQAFYALLATSAEFTGEVFVKCVFNATTTLEELAHLKTIITNPKTVIYLQPETPLTAHNTITLQVDTLQLLALQAGVAQWFEDVRVLPQLHKFLQVS